jgi:hypothetical protein
LGHEKLSLGQNFMEFVIEQKPGTEASYKMLKGNIGER